MTWEETEPIYETLKSNPNYEITTNIETPIIRRKSTHRIVRLWKNHKGYSVISLDGKQCKFHRIIAQQFIPNPDNLKEIDHINRIKDDNRIQNLRWVSSSENSKNKTAYRGVIVNYVDELSDESFEITKYGEHEYENIWFDNNKFYYYTGAAFREICYCKTKCDTLVIHARDTNNKLTTITLNKFKKLYNID